jgi:hypothetical protein
MWIFKLPWKPQISHEYNLLIWRCIHRLLYYLLKEASTRAHTHIRSLTDSLTAALVRLTPVLSPHHYCALCTCPWFPASFSPPPPCRALAFPLTRAVIYAWIRNFERLLHSTLPGHEADHSAPSYTAEEEESFYSWPCRSVSRLVLVSSPFWGSWSDVCFLDMYFFLFYGHHPCRDNGSVFLLLSALCYLIFGIALGYGLDDWDFRVRFPAGAGNFSLHPPPPSITALGPTPPPIQWVPGALSLDVKWPGREADHSPPS